MELMVAYTCLHMKWYGCTRHRWHNDWSVITHQFAKNSSVFCSLTDSLAYQFSMVDLPPFSDCDVPCALNTFPRQIVGRRKLSMERYTVLNSYIWNIIQKSAVSMWKKRSIRTMYEYHALRELLILLHVTKV